MTDKVQKIREEDLGKVGSLKSLEYYPEKKTTNKTSKGVFDANMPRRKAYLRGFKDGAHAHKELIANKPVSEDFEKIIEEIAEPTILNAYGTKELARRLRNTICGTSVSEDLEKASKEWLRPQLDKSYADYGETKMMELTHFDGYAMLDAIEFGAKWQKEQMTKKNNDK